MVIMPFQIDKAICDQTTNCKYDFKCLTQDGCPCCEVEFHVPKELLFVKIKNENIQCPYAMSYGYSYICSCPVRCEIYRKYKK